jgi:hypothetical protein
MRMASPFRARLSRLRDMLGLSAILLALRCAHAPFNNLPTPVGPMLFFDHFNLSCFVEKWNLYQTRLDYLAQVLRRPSRTRRESPDGDATRASVTEGQGGRLHS